MNTNNTNKLNTSLNNAVVYYTNYIQYNTNVDYNIFETLIIVHALLNAIENTDVTEEVQKEVEDILKCLLKTIDVPTCEDTETYQCLLLEKPISATSTCSCYNKE